MEVALALLADAANATASHKLNVLGVFGNIHPAVLPYRHPAMTLVLKFDADPVEADTDKNIQVLLVDPDGREITRLEIQAHIPQPAAPGAPIEMIMQLGMNGVKFDRAGPHAFVILVNGETKKRVPLNVLPQPAPQQNGAQPNDNAAN